MSVRFSSVFILIVSLLFFSPDKWSPALQIRTVLLSIQALLSAPNPDDPLANDVAEKWKSNEVEAIETGTTCHAQQTVTDYICYLLYVCLGPKHTHTLLLKIIILVHFLVFRLISYRYYFSAYYVYELLTN